MSENIKRIDLSRDYVLHKQEYLEAIEAVCNETAFSGGKEIFCKKKGVVEPQFSCRSYKYDVLKREPKSEIISTDYSPEDFKL